MIRCDGLRLALFTDTFSPQMNGVTRTLERLSEAIELSGGEVRMFTVESPGAQTDPRVVRFSAREFWAYKELRLAWPSQGKVQRALDEFAPTLVHSATEFGVGIAGRRAAAAMGIPFVSSYHTNFVEYARHYRLGLLSPFGWSYLRWFHNAAVRTFCPTQSIALQLRQMGFRDLRLWSRGVDTTRFNPSFRSEQLRAQMGANPDTLVVAYVGRLAPEKGIDVAVEAIRIADGKCPERILFCCVGDGPCEREVRRSVPHSAWMPGRLVGDALSRAYASADLFIFPSATDTFGNVLLEAMASGLPVLGADVGPTREIIGDKRGWLVPSGDAAAFAELIVGLVDDRDALRAARVHALAHAANSSWERVWDALLYEYLAVHKSR